MNFSKVFVLISLALVVLMAGQSEAGLFGKIRKEAKRFGKRVERVGQHTRDATIQGLYVAQQAANVGATVRSGQPYPPQGR